MPVSTEQHRRKCGVYFPLKRDKRVRRGSVTPALGLAYRTPSMNTNLCVSLMSIVAFVYLLLILLTMCVDIGKAGPEVSASLIVRLNLKFCFIEILFH